MLSNLPDLSKGAIANPTSANILTSEELASIMPEHVGELWLSYANGLTMIDILTYGFSDRSQLTSSEHWQAHVENYPIKTMTVGGGVTAAITPGGDASFTLATTDLTNSYGQTNYAYYPRVDQVCSVGTNPDYKQCHIRSISGTGTSTVTITIKPSDVTYQITAADIAVGKVIPLGSVVKSTESAATTATKVGYDTYDFYAQVVKEASGFAGMELARKHWFNIDGKYFYDRDVMHKEFLLKAGMNFSLFMGENVTNTAITNVSVADSSAVQVYSTKGLWSWANDKGYDINYTTGSWGMDALDEESEYYISVGVTADQILKVCGNGYYKDVENGAKDYITGASGALNHLFTPLAEGDKHDLTIGFKSIMKNGFKYVLMQDHTFNNPYLLKPLMYNNCISIPMGATKDAKSGNWFPNLSIRYVGNGTANRKMVVGYFPGMTGAQARWTAGTPILSSSDMDNTHWMTHYGVEIREPFSLVRSYPS